LVGRFRVLYRCENKMIGDKNSVEFIIVIVPSKSNLDTIYFGNLLIDALGEARDEGLNIAEFDLSKLADFKFSAKIVPRFPSDDESVGDLLGLVLGALQRGGYGVDSFTIERAGGVVKKDDNKPASKEEAGSVSDPRDTWTDLR
jgi:hypothetical protein